MSFTPNKTTFALVGTGIRSVPALRQLGLKIKAEQAELRHLLSNPNQTKTLLRSKIPELANFNDELTLTPEEIDQALGEVEIKTYDKHLPGAGSVWSPLSNPIHFYNNTDSTKNTISADKQYIPGAETDSAPHFKDWVENDMTSFLESTIEEWKQDRSNGTLGKKSAKPNKFSGQLYQFYDDLIGSTPAELKELLQQAADETDGAKVDMDVYIQDKLFQYLSNGLNSKAHKNKSLEGLKGKNWDDLKNKNKIKLNSNIFTPRAFFGLYAHAMYRDAINVMPSNVSFDHSFNAVNEWDVKLEKDPNTDENRELHYISTNEHEEPYIANAGMLLLGQPKNDLSKDKMFKFAQENSSDVRLFNLDNTQGLDWVDETKTIIIDGSGASAIDVISALTEGRGGSFEPDPENPDELIYKEATKEFLIDDPENPGAQISKKSDILKEPKQILLKSSSGVFANSIAMKTPRKKQLTSANLEFFTPEAIQRLRQKKYDGIVADLKTRHGDKTDKVLQLHNITPGTVKINPYEGLIAEDVSFDANTPIRKLFPKIDDETGLSIIEHDNIAELIVKEKEFQYYMAELPTNKKAAFKKEYLAATRDENGLPILNDEARFEVLEKYSELKHALTKKKQNDNKVDRFLVAHQYEPVHAKRPENALVIYDTANKQFKSGKTPEYLKTYEIRKKEEKQDSNNPANSTRRPRRQFGKQKDYNSFILEQLSTDYENAKKAESSGIKAVENVDRAARDCYRKIAENHGTESTVAKFITRTHARFRNKVAVGPPAIRIAEMIALIKAEKLTVVGPNSTLDKAQNGKSYFTVSSQSIGTITQPVSYKADAVFRAYIPKLNALNHPLTKWMIEAGVLQKDVNIDPITRRAHTPGSLDVSHNFKAVSSKYGKPLNTLTIPGILLEGGRLFSTQNAPIAHAKNDRSMLDVVQSVNPIVQIHYQACMQRIENIIRQKIEAINTPTSTRTKKTSEQDKSTKSPAQTPNVQRIRQNKLEASTALTTFNKDISKQSTMFIEQGLSGEINVTFGDSLDKPDKEDGQ